MQKKTTHNNNNNNWLTDFHLWPTAKAISFMSWFSLRRTNAPSYQRDQFPFVFQLERAFPLTRWPPCANIAFYLQLKIESPQASASEPDMPSHYIERFPSRDNYSSIWLIISSTYMHAASQRGSAVALAVRETGEYRGANLYFQTAALCKTK